MSQEAQRIINVAHRRTYKTTKAKNSLILTDEF
nr:hypothetical protein [Rickettsia endosymbiont of Ceutorhynchus assimilis]